MLKLQDGQSIEVQGSASKPYLIKNVAGCYSCSCPAWRNQSLPIELRTCKHLRGLRGDGAEEARIGAVLRQPVRPAQKPKAPPLLLAESWDGESDPAGWHLSEKLDGVRAYWKACIQYPFCQALSPSSCRCTRQHQFCKVTSSSLVDPYARAVFSAAAGRFFGVVSGGGYGPLC